MNLAEMTTEQLRVALDQASADRLAAKQRGRAIKELLRGRLEAEHAAYYGLTSEEYAEVKARARFEADGDAEEYRTLFQRLLSRARKARAVQVAQAAVASVGAQAKGI